MLLVLAKAAPPRPTPGTAAAAAVVAAAGGALLVWAAGRDLVGVVELKGVQEEPRLQMILSK
jgi:hypothetical protein